MRALDDFRDPRLEFIDADSGLALCLFRRAFQPQIVDLGEDTGFAGHANGREKI